MLNGKAKEGSLRVSEIYLILADQLQNKETQLKYLQDY